jgi:hypothetical protein
MHYQRIPNCLFSCFPLFPPRQIFSFYLEFHYVRRERERERERERADADSRGSNKQEASSHNRWKEINKKAKGIYSSI